MRIRIRRKYHSSYDGGCMKIGRLICAVCDHNYIGSPAYVIIFGLIGTIITALDIMRIMDCKLYPKSMSQPHLNIVPLDIERDLKLVTSILGIEHLTLLMLGAITNYPMLFAPWLMMQSCIIIIEVIVFFGRLFLDGLHLRRNEILLFFWSVHNWMQVFCLFFRNNWYPNL